MSLRPFLCLVFLYFLAPVHGEDVFWKKVESFLHWYHDEEGMRRSPMEKESRLSKGYSPDVHYIIDALKEVESTPLSIGIQTEIFVVPAFSYAFFKVEPPFRTEMNEDDISNLIVYGTAHSGAHTLYGSTSNAPAYFKNKYVMYAPRGGNSLIIPYDNTVETIYISVEGSKAAIWNQFEFANDPRCAAASLALTAIRVGETFIPPHIQLIDGRGMFVEASESITTYLSFNNTESSGPTELFAQTLAGFCSVYGSCSNPFPSYESHELSLSGNTFGRDYVQAILLCDSPTMYYSVLGTGDDSCNVVLSINKAKQDVEVMDDMEISVSIGATDEPEKPYFYTHIPGTSSYKWMKIAFVSMGTTTLYVKQGSRPTEDNYDWKLQASGVLQEESSMESLYIPGTDPAFSKGIFYMCLYEKEDGRTQKHLKISLAPWNPRFI